MDLRGRLRLSRVVGVPLGFVLTQRPEWRLGWIPQGRAAANGNSATQVSGQITGRPPGRLPERSCQVATRVPPPAPTGRAERQQALFPQLPRAIKQVFAQSLLKKSSCCCITHREAGSSFCSRFKPFGFLPPDVSPYWQSGWWYCAERYPVLAP